MKTTESHPLTPFLPEGARILMLGSFPPKRERWSMDFFYPNFNNDMWRIMGTVFFADRHRFEVPGEKRFDREAVMAFCTDKGIALFDTATEVCRLKDNASDKFLEIVTPTDISAILHKIPSCHAVIATGEKAAKAVAAHFGCQAPSPGHSLEISPELRFWRMLSSSRAYPLPIEKKAEAYRKMFISEGFSL